mgnify:CR=1 FL=1|jgi:hypothetical protein
MAKNKIPGPSDSGGATCRTWALGNPEGKHASNLPMLLRRVADQMEYDGIEPMDILALTVEQEMTADGPWWSVQVFWQPDARDEG